MTELTGIIGDIHGNISAIETLVADVRQRASHLVFVGDYINHGKNSADVIEYLIEISKMLPSTTFLRGNHELALLKYIDGGPLLEFLMVGGAATLKSYTQRDDPKTALDYRTVLPVSHIRFLRELQDSYMTDNLLVTHSPRDPIAVTESAMNRRRFRVAGHIPQTDRTPHIGDNFAMIDTGSGTWHDGRLTCFFWPNMEWIQA